MDKAAKSKSDRTRQRIVDAASAAFREHGVDRVGLRDVMKMAGLTRGGFYFHFVDKEALLAEATREAARDNASTHAKWTTGLPDDQKLKGFIDNYLSEEHRDHREVGCALAALGSEVGRSSERHRMAFGEGLDAVIDNLSTLMPGTDMAARKSRAQVLLASLSGVLATARAITDRRRSDELLASARHFFSDAFGT